MKDAVDGSELTRLDLKDVEARYGAPYVVIHRSDLHGVLLRACRAGRGRPRHRRRRDGLRPAGRSGERRSTPVAERQLPSSSRQTGSALSQGRSSSTTSRSARPTSPTAAPCRPLRSRRSGSRCATSSSTSGPGATSCSTRCEEVTCSTRWPSSSRPRRSPVMRTGARPTSSTPRSPRRARRCGRAAAHVARPLVADVRPRADPDVGHRTDRPLGRLRARPAAVPRPGSRHGDGGRLRAVRARRRAARRGRDRGHPRLGRGPRGLRRGAPRALPAGADDRARVGRALAPRG